MKITRAPIVTVLGHVDHGKTTLLDAIRKTRVAEREAGGITQGIGATKLQTKNGSITFVDTPGHAAFSQMRARGAKVADIAILVVAADDGPMPQTKEALKYILDNEIPYVVAFTKVDLPSANVERAISQMEQESVLFEGRGGQVPHVEVSGKAGTGIDDLLEMVELLAGVSEIDGDPDGNLSARVIETNKDKRGSIVSVVVKNGTLKVGDDVHAGSIEARVKGLFGDDGKPVKKATLSDPVAILGFSELPEAGTEVTEGKASAAESHDKLSDDHKKVGDEQLGLVVKAQTAGALEAIIASLPEDAIVLESSVGDVSESDVFFAKSAGAIILSFDSKVPGGVKKLAEAEHVEINEYKVIYELLEYVKETLEAKKTKILGKADILDEFPFNNVRVAGCKVSEGRIRKEDRLVLMRGTEELGEAKIGSMRRGKESLAEAKVGEECGIVITPQLPFEKGDILVATKAPEHKK